MTYYILLKEKAVIKYDIFKENMTKVLKIKKITSEIVDSINSKKYSDFYINWLLNNEQDYLFDNQLKNSIIKNINTPITLLLKFYEIDNCNTELVIDSISKKIIDLDDIFYLKELFFKYEDDNFIIEAISKSKIIDRELIDLIIKNHTNLVINLINNDKLTLDEIVKINDNSSYGLKEYAFNYLKLYVSSIDSSIKLEKLMNYTSKDLNYFIAQNKYISDELFNILSLSNDFRTRAILAGRIDTPIEILYSFVDDESDSVRLALAKNINIDKKVLSSLALDNKVTIIKEVIAHSKTDIVILDLIINSSMILDSTRKLAKEQKDKLNNLAVISNFDYYNIMEKLKSGKILEIIFDNEKDVDSEREKVLINLED